MINIRPHTRKDLELRVKWLNNEKATEHAFVDSKSEATLESQEKWFDEYEGDETRSFFTIESDEKPIGFMGLSEIDFDKKKANLFIMIGEDDFRGKSVGKHCMHHLIDYAFDDLSLESLELEVPRKNKIAVILYGKLGFKEISGDESMIRMSLEKEARI